MVDHYDFSSEELATMSPRSLRRLGIVLQPPSEAAPYRPPLQYEFKCNGCGETFCDNEMGPHATELIEHGYKQDGTWCGSTKTTLEGTWGPR